MTPKKKRRLKAQKTVEQVVLFLFVEIKALRAEVESLTKAVLRQENKSLKNCNGHSHICNNYSVANPDASLGCVGCSDERTKDGAQ